ncbi:hypothetical protein F5Y17DRAFT_460259 [Xylariaceae sp. FL0594]|nr:hypothetical protein F5Y17DRAFT_460259 [Xylariaceae sp. FL0594]
MRLSTIILGLFATAGLAVPVENTEDAAALLKRCDSIACATEAAYSIVKRTPELEALLPRDTVEKRCTHACSKDTAYRILKRQIEIEDLVKRCNTPKCAKDTAYSINKREAEELAKRCNTPKCAKDTAYSINKRTAEVEGILAEAFQKRCTKTCAKDTAYRILKRELEAAEEMAL